MKLSVAELKSILSECLLSEGTIDDEFNTINVGDVVDVDNEYMGTVPVTVVELVDDVRASVGMSEDEKYPGSEDFRGPGIVGEIDPESGESGQMVFSMNQVVPGSKLKGYFPKEDGDWGEERDDVVPDLYRRMAARAGTKERERPGSYVHGLPDDMSDITKNY